MTASVQNSIVICEPTIALEHIGRVVPDLLVLQGNQVTAAVELKFVPHDFPQFEGDLQKLRAYGSSHVSFPIMVEPTTGRFANDPYEFSPDCLLVFAAIGRHDSSALDRSHLFNLMRTFEDRFLTLLLPVRGSRTQE